MNFESAFKFLRALGKNNDRDWFEKNKPRYLVIKDEFDQFVAEALGEMQKFDESLNGANPKKLPYRIYRDVRFSKDKKPYKLNLSAGFSPRARLEQEAGYYLHIQPGDKSFIAGGMYVPDPPNLAKIRQEIDYNSAKFLAIIEDKKFKHTFGSLRDDDKLKTSPKGYSPEHPQIDILRNRSFTVAHPFTDEEVMHKKFLANFVKTAAILRPLNVFLTEAIA